MADTTYYDLSDYSLAQFDQCIDVLTKIKDATIYNDSSPFVEKISSWSGTTAPYTASFTIPANRVSIGNSPTISFYDSDSGYEYLIDYKKTGETGNNITITLTSNSKLNVTCVIGNVVYYNETGGQS